MTESHFISEIYFGGEYERMVGIITTSQTTICGTQKYLSKKTYATMLLGI